MKKLIITDDLTIRKKVHNYVREQILRGEIRPNERLVEVKIASEIGTSRTPVREALHSLELEGLIESIPRVGYVVKGLDDQEVAEIWEIRCLIEGLAARWAAEKAGEKTVRELKKNMEQAEEKVARGDLMAFADLDAQFHEIIARLSGGKRLLELSQTLRRHALRYRIESINRPDTALRAIEGHKKIIEAIEDGKPEGILDAIKSHLEQSKKDTLRYAFKGRDDET
jgi:DNA-binding GntR family transcriptional regulator